jgi:ATP-dependent 26S proteasome regulatory subunit
MFEKSKAVPYPCVPAMPKRNNVMITARNRPTEDWSDVINENFMSQYVHWTSSDGRVFVPAAPTVQILTPGVYEISISQNIGLFFERIPVRSEGLLRFPDTNSDKVVAEIQKFWNREDIFNEYGLTYKRGILLYGPPGSGKSCTIQLIMEDVVSRCGIVLKFNDPNLFIDGMRIFRQIQPDAPVVVIMEDIDSTLEQFSETEILNILDGVNEVNKVVFLATTNYPERLGPRIVNRPSRFDKRFRIGYPSALSRKMYFEHIIAHDQESRLKEKISELKIDLDQWVADTDGMSIAHLKELFIQVVILGDSYEESIETLRSMTETIEDKDYDSSIGFFKNKKTETFYD